MAKYSFEFKLKVVLEYLEGRTSQGILYKKYSIPSPTAIKRWINAYETLGPEGLKRSRKNNFYPLDFKLNVVKLYLSGEGSYQCLANKLDLNNSSLITRWVSEFRNRGIEGIRDKKKEGQLK